jgi:cell division transport system permease protein
MPAVDAVVDLTPGEGSTNWSGCSTPPVSLDGRRVTVFLRLEATDQQREAIAAELRSLPGIARFDFASRQEAYERFKELYACAPELVDATRAESLPESFNVTLTDPSAGQTVKDQISRLPGVDAVVHFR